MCTTKWAVVIAFFGFLAVSPVWAQQPITTQLSGSGNPVDPSKNVLDALLAAVTRLNDITAAYHKRQDDLRDTESKFQNAMRNADTQRLNDLREADTRRLNELREAETRRIDQLSLQKQTFDLELARVIRAGVDGSALLLATQVKELKTDSSERTAKLEQFANEQRGRASQADPANMKLLEEVALLRTQRAGAAGSDAGRAEIWALIGFLAVLLLSAIAIIVNLMKRNDTPQSIADAVVRRTNGNG